MIGVNRQSFRQLFDRAISDAVRGSLDNVQMPSDQAIEASWAKVEKQLLNRNTLTCKGDDDFDEFHDEGFRTVAK